jgi:hypothetical protein
MNPRAIKLPEYVDHDLLNKALQRRRRDLQNGCLTGTPFKVSDNGVRSRT